MAVIFSLPTWLCRQRDIDRGLVSNQCDGIPAVLFCQQHKRHAADNWQGRRCEYCHHVLLWTALPM